MRLSLDWSDEGADENRNEFQAMNALLWLIAIIVGLVSSVYQLGALAASIRSLKPDRIAIALLLLIAFGAAMVLSREAVVVMAVGAVTGFAAWALLRRTTRNSEHAAQSAKMAAVYLTLLAGTLLFMVPFGWLISTSLKPDDQQAVFPPVWIPTQQITTDKLMDQDNKPAKISILDGTQRVAEVVQLPSGDVRVVPIDETGTGLRKDSEVVKRESLTKIRAVSPRWENYRDALLYLPKDTYFGLTFLWNSLLLTFLTVLGTLFSSSMVAYSFSRLHWPGRDQFFVVLLATMMVPGAITLMPQFLIFRSLGWIDTLNPLWVPAFFGSAFNIFLLRQFFMSIPTELEDAAKIDGCGPFGIYWRVMLPLVKPAMAAIAIMGVLGAWNNFQGPLIYLSSPEKMPLAYGLQLFQTQYSSEPGMLMAASSLVLLPIIILFFFTQRYFIEGVSLTGLGGR